MQGDVFLFSVSQNYDIKHCFEKYFLYLEIKNLPADTNVSSGDIIQKHFSEIFYREVLKFNSAQGKAQEPLKL